jgi:hypothetical protein
MIRDEKGKPIGAKVVAEAMASQMGGWWDGSEEGEAV